MRFLVALGCLALFPRTVLAHTWGVPAPGPGNALSVQAGIDSAADGDTVLVSPGVYYENLDLKGKGIHLLSSGGPLITVLNGGQRQDAVVKCRSGERRDTIIEGFTIRGGTGVEAGNFSGAGGVYILDAEPSIIGNVIFDNTAPSYGGGIYCQGSLAGGEWHPLIQGNTITGNTTDAQGGGICTVNKSAPHILDNVISENTSERGDGGGISLLLAIDGALVSSNTIQGNRAKDHGGGIYAGLSSTLRGPLEMEISLNLIAGNVAERSSATEDCGGGVWLSKTDALMSNNTIVDNGCDLAGAPGGGVALRGTGSPLLERNIIARTTQGGGIFCNADVTPTIRDNLAWANAGGDGLGGCGSWTAGNGNEVADPLFCNATVGNYLLAQASPALSHPAGPLGAFPESGCLQVPVVRVTWGGLKARFK